MKRYSMILHHWHAMKFRRFAARLQDHDSKNQCPKVWGQSSLAKYLYRAALKRWNAWFHLLIVFPLRFLRFHTQTRHLGWFCFSLPVQTEPSFPSRFRVSLFLMGGQEGLLKSKPSGSVFLTSKIDGNENNQHNQHSYALVFHNYKSEMDFPNPRMKLRALQNTKQR